MTQSQIAHDTHPYAVDLAKRWNDDPEVVAPVEFYGEQKSSTYRLLKREVCEQGQLLSIALEQGEHQLKTSRTGSHNALNLLAASAIGEFIGLSAEQIKEGVAVFQGVVGRQQIVKEANGIVLMENLK